MITLDGKAMTTETVERVAAGEGVQLAPAAVERVAQAWRTITAIEAERPVYGRTTGVGANRDIVISPEEQRAHGARLIDSHATAVGEPLPSELVRAMIGVRVNQLAAGGSGISPDVVTALAGLLAREVVPAVRDGGSIGTGDLPALGQIARSLDVELAGGDALALMSSNALTLARAALCSASLQRLARAGLTVTALTVRAADGNVEAFCETVHDARPHEGQRAAAAAVRLLLETAGPWKAARVQDSYGLRAAAQVAGPLLDAAARLERTLCIELNAVAENPMVDVSGRRVLHNANFHLAALALDLDAARVALYQAAALSVARLAELMDPGTTGLAPFLAGEPAGSSGALGLEYVAHAALARLGQAARATTLATATLSRGVEGHAPFAPQGAHQLEVAIAAGRDVLACELVAALRALRQKAVDLTGPLGESVAQANAVIDADMADRDLSPDLDAAIGLLDDLAILSP